MSCFNPCLPCTPAPKCCPPVQPPAPPVQPPAAAAAFSGSLCGDPYFVSLSLPFAGNREPRETAVASFDISKYTGSVLPVSKFSLDDFVFVVKADFDIMSAYTLTGTTRNINLPPETLIVVDGKNPMYASGAVDDGMTTNYTFNGKTYSIPGGQVVPLSTAIKGVIDLGVPFQPHDKISLQQMQELGFRVGDKVAFKLMAVAHGMGNVTLDFNVPQC